MNMESTTKHTETSLHYAEKKLIEYMRKMRWGSVEITIQDGIPVLIKEAIKTIKLT